MDEVLQLTIAIFLGMMTCFYIWKMYMLKKTLLEKMGGKYIVVRMHSGDTKKSKVMEYIFKKLL